MRNQEIKAERRRRDTKQLAGARRKLALDESKLDRKNFEYRYANDDKNRLYDLTVRDDWEVVQGERMNDTAALGSQVAVRAGAGSDGQSMNTVLLRKPKKYYDEDVAARQRQIDETERALKGKPAEAEDETTYVPDGRSAVMTTEVET